MLHVRERDAPGASFGFAWALGARPDVRRKLEEAARAAAGVTRWYLLLRIKANTPEGAND